MFYPCRTLATALLPEQVVEVIKNEKFKDKQVFGITQLLLNAAIGATETWLKGELRQIEGNYPKMLYRGFDPNPGDGGCHKRGYLHLQTL